MQKTPQNSVYISYIIRFLKFFTVKKKFQQNSPVICNKFKVFLGVFGILDVDFNSRNYMPKTDKTVQNITANFNFPVFGKIV